MTGTVPRVLVAVASRHGATQEIAEALARRLTDIGPTAVALPVAPHLDPARYAAVVLGSAVYAGRWLEPARDWAAANAGTLRTRPVWLFSSGPIGEAPFPPDEPHDAAPVAALIRSRGHMVFPGRIDPARLGFAEHAVVTAMRAPVGDFRDWDAVRRWADRIATELRSPAAADPAVAIR